MFSKWPKPSHDPVRCIIVASQLAKPGSSMPCLERIKLGHPSRIPCKPEQKVWLWIGCDAYAWSINLKAPLFDCVTFEPQLCPIFNVAWMSQSTVILCVFTRFLRQTCIYLPSKSSHSHSADGMLWGLSQDIPSLENGALQYANGHNIMIFISMIFLIWPACWNICSVSPSMHFQCVLKLDNLLLTWTCMRN